MVGETSNSDTVTLMTWPEADRCVFDNAKSPDCLACYDPTPPQYPGDWGEMTCARGKYILTMRAREITDTLNDLDEEVQA